MISPSTKRAPGALWRMLIALQEQHHATSISLSRAGGTAAATHECRRAVTTATSAAASVSASASVPGRSTSAAGGVDRSGRAVAATPAAAAATAATATATTPPPPPPPLVGRRALHSSASPAASASPDAAAASATPTTLARPGRGRFYDTVRIAPVPDPAALQRQAGRAPPPPPPPGSRASDPPPPAPAPWWQLLLRGYPVKTPGQNAMLLPTRALALAVAGEWEWLDRGRPLSVAMPLTSLCATALDEPKPRAAVERGLLKFVHTDAAAVRYDPGTALERKQAEAFDALLAWAADPAGPIRAPDGPLRPSSSVAGAPQTDASERAFARYLASLDAWTLAAVDQVTAASKSLVVGAALAHGRVTVEEAVTAARLEEDHQTGEWGVVEAGHDLDAADARTRVASAAVMLRLLRME